MVCDLVKDRAVLTKAAQPATAEDSAVAQDVEDTLASLDDASCLAANQIGYPKAIGAYRDNRGRIHVLFNPTITFKMQPFKTQEGCLTKDEPSRVTRYRRIRVSYDALEAGKLVHHEKAFGDWYAEMVQHIVDHIAGAYV